MCPRVVSRSVSVLVATGGMRLCSVNAHGHGENEPSDLWSSYISSTGFCETQQLAMQRSLNSTRAN